MDDLIKLIHESKTFIAKGLVLSMFWKYVYKLVRSETQAMLIIIQLYNLWDFQLNTEVAQQSHEDQPSLNLVEILNVSSEDREELSLNISLEEVLAADAIDNITVIGDETDRVLES